jgi:4-carboxymuconolactone decarboxylase
MNNSNTGQNKHDELWPDFKSKARQTDPELIEVFDNFTFDEVIWP